MNSNDKIYVAGHRGLVGSAIVRQLAVAGYRNVVTRTHKELDLLDYRAVESLFKKEKPDYVFLAAAKVGGIMANDTHPAEFIYENLQIQNNIIHQSYLNGIKKLLFLGSSCIYPRESQQPIKEEYLLSGYLEQTNEPYALAKIAGIKLCQSYNRQYGTCFIGAMPTNLYGANDHFDLENSHVIPALIRKFYEAKKNEATEVVVWGTGKPRREFLHVDDMARACLFLMEKFTPTAEQNKQGAIFFNVGTGTDVTIAELVKQIQTISGFKGEVRFDTTKPDGTMRKLLDCTKINVLGWKYSIPFEKGLEDIYKLYGSQATKE